MSKLSAKLKVAVATFFSAWLLIAALPSTKATIIQCVVTGTFTNSDFPAAIALQDSFTCTLAYNDSALDSDSSTNKALFSNAVTAFTLKLNSGAVGNYGGGFITAPDVLVVDSSAASDTLYMDPQTGLGTINGSSVSVQVYLITAAHANPIRDIGGGQSIRSMLGGTPRLNSFASAYLVVSAGKSKAKAGINSLNVQPPPMLTGFRVRTGQLQLTWPTNALGWSLETTASSQPPVWSAVTNAPAIMGGSYAVTVNIAGSEKLFRLHNP